MKKIVEIYKLMTYGFKARLNLILCAVFLAIGLLYEFGVNAVMASGESTLVFQITGSIFLSCVPLFGVQMLYSLTTSAYINSSAINRKLKTDYSVLAAGTLSFFILLILIVMKGILYVLSPNAAMSMWYELIYYAMVHALLLIYTVFLFRFFLATFFVLYLSMFAFGAISGMSAAGSEGFNVMALIPEFTSPLAYILISALIVAAGLAAFYALSLLLYKVSMSKRAFGAGLNR